MKRSYAFDSPDSLTRTSRRNRCSIIMQPDFPSLGIGFNFESPAPEAIQIANDAFQQKSCSFGSTTSFINRSQCRRDVFNHVSNMDDVFGRRMNASEQRETTDKIYGNAARRSAIASSGSTTSTKAIPSRCPQPLPPEVGRTPLFAIGGCAMSSFSPSRGDALNISRSSVGMDAAPIVHATLVDPASIDSPSDILADAATFAACWMMLKVLEQRAARRPSSSSPPPPPPAAGDLEEFSLGPGRPAA